MRIKSIVSESKQIQRAIALIKKPAAAGGFVGILNIDGHGGIGVVLVHLQR